MIYRTLGDCRQELSALTLGTWGIGGAGWGETSEPGSIRAIQTMLDQGVNVVDTAPVYGFVNPAAEDMGFGYAETVVGKAIRGRRDKVFLVTKCGLNYDREKGPRSMYKCMSAKEIREGCEASLRRLGTDCLDLLFVHWPDQSTPLEEVAQAMQGLMQEGKIRYYGLSNFTAEDTLRLHAMLPVQAVQLQFSMVEQSQRETLKTLHDAGIGTMVYGALGSGILTGAYRTIPKFEAFDVRSSFYHFFEEPTFSKIQQLLAVMDRIAQERQVALSQIALNWTVSNSFVDTAIVGVSKVRHAEQCAAALDFTLSGEECALLTRTAAELLA